MVGPPKGKMIQRLCKIGDLASDPSPFFVTDMLPILVPVKSRVRPFHGVCLS